MPFFGNFTLLIFKITQLEYTSGDGWTSLIHSPPHSPSHFLDPRTVAQENKKIIEMTDNCLLSIDMLIQV